MVFNIWKVGGVYEPLNRPAMESSPFVSPPIDPVGPLDPGFLKNSVDKEKKEKRSKDDFKGVEWNFQEDWLAGQYMSFPVVTLSPDASLKEAWELFTRTRYHYIPVVDEKQSIMGILSDRDLLRKISQIEKKSEYTLDHTSVSSAMIYPVLATEAQTPLNQVALMLLRKHIGCMPITDKEGHVIGILTRSDLLRAILGIRRDKFLIKQTKML